MRDRGPRITSVTTAGGPTKITGTVPASGTFQVQVFSNPNCGDPEGRLLLASFNENGESWTATVPALSSGAGVTATDTRAGCRQGHLRISSC